jgi:glycosidase
VDGYRLDYANGPGPVFWTHFRRACKAAKPDCLIFGEIVEPSDMLRKYLGRLDGCLDFPMNSALRHTFAYQSWDSTRFEAFCQAHQAYFDADFVMPSFIDNHDMDRFSFIARNDPERLKQAIAMQFQLPQPPVIFGGSEVGLKQLLSTREHRLDVCRPPMPWGEEDHELLAFYKQQIQARKAQLHTDEMTG